ncbi:hypothetical protein EYF80_053088 [Liparis tanakae]|uniref:Uncharacterized protein n=1 Tax=Liparis tanakae TaxID=230148 RepID=A0A4Z2F7F8_9TELE|nr:hypothetical protein EYF80_053088 [Liparis tanakae]
MSSTAAVIRSATRSRSCCTSAGPRSFSSRKISSAAAASCSSMAARRSRRPHRSQQALLVLLEGGQSGTDLQQRDSALLRAARHQPPVVLQAEAVQGLVTDLKTTRTLRSSTCCQGNNTKLTKTSRTVEGLVLRMSQTSNMPSIFTVKKTEGRTGLQQASVR